MFSYYKRKKEKRELKRTFKEYGFEVKQFDVEGLGKVEYAQWLHPFEGPKEVTKEQVSFYQKLAKKGDLIIDIGAHTGDTTVPMALAVGKQGLVIGLEPNIYVYKILEKNAQLNQDLTNIVPLPFAATQEDGDFVFHYSDASFCNGGYLSQIKNQRHNHSYELKVEGRNFSKYLRENYQEWLPKMGLLKVDAEGYDSAILDDMSDIIAEFRPNIMAECYKKLSMDERYALYDAIAKHDYTVYMNDTDYLEDGFVDSADLVKLTRDNMKIKKHFEILATPN
ncbi:FkbM family methyltransferase [Roseivirga sp.]|uniref:FkbM family methyltransferase n=1 Tax=Roseivirga sp. TaxID=1964215 RepID=UPI003B8C2205